MPLEYDTVALNTLQPHPKNPRVGDVDVIAASLTDNQQYKPIVVQRSTRFVLAGNHTMLAARSLGWDHIDVVWADVDDDHAERILLVDNRSSDLGYYNDQLLADILSARESLTGTGYSPGDLDDLLFTAPPPIDLPPNVADTGGVNVAQDSVVWGYLQIGQPRRVACTDVEIERLNAIHDAYTAENTVDSGLGHAIADALDGVLGIDSTAIAENAIRKAAAKVDKVKAPDPADDDSDGEGDEQ